MSGQEGSTGGSSMNYFVNGISAEVTPIRNIRNEETEFYLVVIMDGDTIDPETQSPKILYKGTYHDPLDATEAAVVWIDTYMTKRDSMAARAKAA
jgi:hypothetical protein